MPASPRITAPIPGLAHRVTKIHTHLCKHCPSSHFPPDPEALDYKAAPRAEQLESVFRCGWRKQKACKGYCDFLGVSEADLVDAFGGGRG